MKNAKSWMGILCLLLATTSIACSSEGEGEDDDDDSDETSSEIKKKTRQGGCPQDRITYYIGYCKWSCGQSNQKSHGTKGCVRSKTKKNSEDFLGCDCYGSLD